jgi:LacI family transcriptional regulator
MADVAARAAVSISTVSHVINGTRPIAPETLARVRVAIAELNYQGSTRFQASGFQRAIGFVASNASYAYFAEVVQGVESAARELGYALLLCDSHDDPEIERQSVATLLAHRVDGVLLSPTNDWTRSALPVLRRGKLPFVLVDRTSDVKCDQVVTENTSPAQTLVEHLAEAGHQRIAMLTGLPRLSTTAERLEGYLRALERHEIPRDLDLIVSGRSDSRGGRRGVRKLLQLADPPTAIFCSNDAMTVGALLALRDMGRRVPEDIAVVAFDDFEWADAFTPAITTAAQPAYTIGTMAVRMLQQRISDPVAPPRISRLPTEIMHRTSCGCARPPARARRRPGS